MRAHVQFMFFLGHTWFYFTCLGGRPCQIFFSQSTGKDNNYKREYNQEMPHLEQSMAPFRSEIIAKLETHRGGGNLKP